MLSSRQRALRRHFFSPDTGVFKSKDGEIPEMDKKAPLSLIAASEWRQDENEIIPI